MTLVSTLFGKPKAFITPTHMVTSSVSPHQYAKHKKGFRLPVAQAVLSQWGMFPSASFAPVISNNSPLLLEEGSILEIIVNYGLLKKSKNERRSAQTGLAYRVKIQGGDLKDQLLPTLTRKGQSFPYPTPTFTQITQTLEVYVNNVPVMVELDITDVMDPQDYLRLVCSQAIDIYYRTVDKPKGVPLCDSGVTTDTAVKVNQLYGNKPLSMVTSSDGSSTTSTLDSKLKLASDEAKVPLPTQEDSKNRIDGVFGADKALVQSCLGVALLNALGYAPEVFFSLPPYAPENGTVPRSAIRLESIKVDGKEKDVLTGLAAIVDIDKLFRQRVTPNAAKAVIKMQKNAAPRKQVPLDIPVQQASSPEVIGGNDRVIGNRFEPATLADYTAGQLLSEFVQLPLNLNVVESYLINGTPRNTVPGVSPNPFTFSTLGDLTNSYFIGSKSTSVSSSSADTDLSGINAVSTTHFISIKSRETQWRIGLQEANSFNVVPCPGLAFSKYEDGRSASRITMDPAFLTSTVEKAILNSLRKVLPTKVGIISLDYRVYGEKSWDESGSTDLSMSTLLTELRVESSFPVPGLVEKAEPNTGSNLLYLAHFDNHAGKVSRFVPLTSFSSEDELLKSQPVLNEILGVFSSNIRLVDFPLVELEPIFKRPRGYSKASYVTFRALTDNSSKKLS